MLEDMDRPGFFKDYYKCVRKAVSQEQINQFAKLASDEEKVRFCFEQVAAVHEIDIQTFYYGKSERDALDKKEAGNKEFGKKNNLDALKCYSQAVVKAPVLSEENSDARKMTLYSICLANRSAALYHMNDYYHCIKDIDEALEHHYPKELKYKLYKRKGRILVTLKRHLEAKDAYRQAIKWLDWAKCDREKRMEIQRDIQKWLKLFETGKVVKNWSDMPVPKQAPIPNLTAGLNPVFPSLSGKLEMKFSPVQGRYIVAKEDINIGDCLVVDKPYAAVLIWGQYGSHCQNCFMLTRAPIPCGTCSAVVFCSSDCRDAAYFHKMECTIGNLLHGSGMSINCFLAFRMLTQTPLEFFVKNSDRLKVEEPMESTLDLKPLKLAHELTNGVNNNQQTNGTTENAVTNGETQKPLSENFDDMNSNEKKELQNGEEKENDEKENSKDPLTVDTKNLSEEEKKKLVEEEEKQREALLAQRIKDEEEEYEKVRRRIEEVKKKKLEEQRLKEEIFWRVYYLVRHSSDRTVEDYFHRTVMACFMLKSLQKTKYFDLYKRTGIGMDSQKLTEQEALAGGLLLRFLQIIQFNAHEVSEFIVTAPKQLEGAKNTSLGAAIYPTLAYFNHSCHSAQVRYFSGHSVITKAVRPIAKGDLVPENYGPCYSSAGKSERKNQLVDRYWFDCQCEACTENWPTFLNIDDSKMKFKCHKCSSPILVKVDSPNPLYKCVNCGDQTNILAALKNLTNSEKTYSAACKEIEDKNLEKAETLLKENLEQLSSCLCPPYKDYHLTQEAYMKCVLNGGNRRVKPAE